MYRQFLRFSKNVVAKKEGWAFGIKSESVRMCHHQGHEKMPYLTQLTDDELVLQRSIRKFAREQVAPLVTKMDEEEKIDDNLVRDLFRNGFMSIEIPEDQGGAGANFMSTILAVEEFSKVEAGIGGVLVAQNTVINAMIHKLGSDELTKKYLPKTTQEFLGCFALSEPSTGSDAFSLLTTAKKDGGHYILNGNKMWSSFAEIAGVFIIFANTDPKKGRKGLTAFIVDRDTEGLKVGKKESKLGIRSWTTSKLHLDNVRVPEENILGQFGQGYKHAIECLNESRIGIGAQMIGIAQGALDATVPYLFERKQFGQELYSFQGLQHQVATMATQLEAARLLVYNAARLKESGKPIMKEASMAKYYSSEVAQQVTIKCIDWMGGVGFTKDFPHEKFYRDVKIGSLYEGTTNMQLNTIAKAIRKAYSN